MQPTHCSMLHFPGTGLSWDSSLEAPLHSTFSESELELEGLQDSISRRRRHAVYLHRPPVWQSRTFQEDSSSTSFPGNSVCGLDNYFDGNSSFCSLSWPQETCDIETSAPATLFGFDSDSDMETPLLESELSHGQLALPSRSRPEESSEDPFCQPKPIFCTRLQSYRDIRLGMGEQWAIQEGSLVIGIDPSHTLLYHHEKRLDEFEVAGGDLYIVCCMYADLWALCAKISSIPFPNKEALRLAFLPLCAVTLAANFGAFVRRNTQYALYSVSQERRYPGNGLPVTPPLRSHSLNGSKQIFRSHMTHISVPLVVRDVFQNLSLRHTDADFEPLDSTLEPMLSSLTSRRRRLLRSLETGGSFLKFRGGAMQPIALRYSHHESLSPPSRHQLRSESIWKGRRHLRNERHGLSRVGHTFRWWKKKSW